MNSALIFGLLLVFAATLDHEWITALALVLAFTVTVLSSRWGALYARTLRETLEEGSVDAVGTHEGNEDLMPMIDGPRLKVLLDAIDTGSPRSRELALMGLYQWLASAEEGALIEAHIREQDGFDKCDLAHFELLLHGCLIGDANGRQLT